MKDNPAVRWHLVALSYGVFGGRVGAGTGGGVERGGEAVLGGGVAVAGGVSDGGGAATAGGEEFETGPSDWRYSRIAEAI